MNKKIINYYPKNFLKTIISLRNFIMKQHIIGKNTEIYNNILKKIYLLEGLTFKNDFNCNINLGLLSNILCKTAHLKNNEFCYEIICGNACHCVNFKLYEILLCKIIKNSKNVFIKINQNSFILKTKSFIPDNTLKIIFKELGVLYINNLRGNYIEIIAPLTPANKVNYHLKNELYYLNNIFSPFNIY